MPKKAKQVLSRAAVRVLLPSKAGTKVVPQGGERERRLIPAVFGDSLFSQTMSEGQQMMEKETGGRKKDSAKAKAGALLESCPLQGLPGPPPGPPQGLPEPFPEPRICRTPRIRRTPQCVGHLSDTCRTAPAPNLSDICQTP